MHADKRRGRFRSRILYWFRTPPGVKVGRAALDEEAIRLIEENNPQVDFDWTRILKGETPEPRRPEPPRREFRPREPPAQGRRPPVSETRGIPSMPREPGFGASSPAHEAPAVEAPAMEADAPEAAATDTAATEDLLAATPPASMADDPSRGVGTRILDSPAEVSVGFEPAPTPAHARLGAEGVLRLRARYAEILTRIADRVSDPARQEELKSQAERLNPDGWVTADEVRLGLEQYETVFDSLRAVVGKRRRRRRRRSDGSPGGSGSPDAEASSAGADGDDPSGDGDERGPGEL